MVKRHVRPTRAPIKLYAYEGGRHVALAAWATYTSRRRRLTYAHGEFHLEGIHSLSFNIFLRCVDWQPANGTPARKVKVITHGGPAGQVGIQH